MDHSQVGDCTMQEYSYVDLDGAGLPELDGALLMELLEDSPALDAPEDDRLSHVIRSLEAEIGGGPAAVGDGESTTRPSDVDGGLEDMLSDFGGYDGGPFEYWAEMPAGHEMGGWYVDGEGGEGAIVGYELRDQYYAEGSLEQAYSPLWETGNEQTSACTVTFQAGFGFPMDTSLIG